MFKNRLTAACIIFLCLIFCLPAFTSGQEKTNVATIEVCHTARRRRPLPQQYVGDNHMWEASPDADLIADSVSFARGLGNQASLTTTYVIPWAVLNEGGQTEEATSASYRLKDAIGQSVIGKCESASYKAYIGFWSPKSLWVVGVEEMQETRSTMQETKLFQNYPNPFTLTTVINYQLPVSSEVSLRIYDISGRLVKTLVDGTKAAGRYKAGWDGRDNYGRKAAGGIYFYKLKAHSGREHYTETDKMTLLR